MLTSIDLHQSGDIRLDYTESMKIALAQLCLLLAVILLITGGAIAGVTGQASGMGVGVTTDPATSTSALHNVMDHVASTDQDNHRAPCGDCLNCVHPTGSGCCAAGISASECDVLHDAPVAVRFMVGKAFLPTGIDPEALLQPPQTFA
ncbi:hypothetical protein EOA13_28025 [Mesorhizobium sp. M7A.F.Ca.US.011.01.1.1]|uniref:hypothetical protein n=1 Tax=unclassified Mesorhizobium TaxID=325217 RepID=UPI000FC9A91D|nr:MULTISPECIES: hypothetical protein [unclassified Mesorhizobium]RUW87729.1 hypothetical protein EOA19_32690 [Mesorhizobium sp. M7A.F.Ca.US.010.02.1.1]RUX25254.1 hypothetical protein EOA13_28025 [Mesorhizobium sp. M7A.F.Ca.US.011.01.1.1]